MGGVSSLPSGLETPDVIDLRKAKAGGKHLDMNRIHTRLTALLQWEFIILVESSVLYSAVVASVLHLNLHVQNVPSVTFLSLGRQLSNADSAQQTAKQGRKMLFLLIGPPYICNGSTRHISTRVGQGTSSILFFFCQHCLHSICLWPHIILSSSALSRTLIQLCLSIFTCLSAAGCVCPSACPSICLSARHWCHLLWSLTVSCCRRQAPVHSAGAAAGPDCSGQPHG